MEGKSAIFVVERPPGSLQCVSPQKVQDQLKLKITSSQEVN
jgi:hypothetical protein